MNFLPMKTVYECRGNRSTSFLDILPRHLTIDRSFCKERFQYDNRTAFREVKVANFDTVTPWWFKELPKVHHGRISEDHRGLISRVRSTLKATIETHWEPGAHHAILHSSGYDSRCLSWLIRELYHEHGDDWLGTVLFICTKWEAKPFRAIMRYEGWRPDQYFVPYPARRDRGYYASSLLDFRGAWRWSDGTSSIPVNLFWYPITTAIEEGRLPHDGIQTWTGHNGNIVLSMRGPREIQSLMRESYYGIFGQRPMYGDTVVHPYSTLEMTKVVCESSTSLTNRLRPLLLRALDPKLAAFRNIHSDGDRHHRIADWIIDRMVADYRRSWYGRNVKPDARPQYKTTEFQNFFYHWTLASLCEHLRSEGYVVR